MYLYMLSVYIRELSLKGRGKVVDIPRHEVLRYDIFIVLKQIVYFATDVGRKNKEK